jgi:hypothetical protein
VDGSRGERDAALFCQVVDAEQKLSNLLDFTTLTYNVEKPSSPNCSTQGSLRRLPSAQPQNGEKRPWAPPSFLHENVSNGYRMRQLTPARMLQENRSWTRSSRAGVDGQRLLLLSAFAAAASTCRRTRHSSTWGAQSTGGPTPRPRSTPHDHSPSSRPTCLRCPTRSR